MPLFSEATITQAHLKAGIFGFNGSGKTRTAIEIAIGLTLLLKKRGLPQGDRPIYFLDTETGSDFVKHLVEGAGLKLFTAKTRAFSDLIPAYQEAERNASVIVTDSITHFWREFTETYAKKKNKTQLTMADWGFLKKEWGRFTDIYVNSGVHAILCGRAGFEYDNFVDDEGRKQMEKTGVKMKAEGEMGYEPSLILFMDRETDLRTNVVTRVASVLKDRFDVIDGKSFAHADTGGPKFEDFLPHIERLNLGGRHVGVDTSRTSEAMIPEHGKEEWRYRKEQAEILLDQVQALFTKHMPGRAAEEQRRKVILLERFFGQGGSWKAVETLPVEVLKRGHDALKAELEAPQAVDAAPPPMEEPPMPAREDSAPGLVETSTATPPSPVETVPAPPKPVNPVALCNALYLRVKKQEGDAKAKEVIAKFGNEGTSIPKILEPDLWNIIHEYKLILGEA